MSKEEKLTNKQPSILLNIYDNALLRTKVNTALDMGQRLEDIAKICEKYGVKASLATLSRYSKAYKESIKNGTDLRKELDGATKEKVNRLKGKEVKEAPKNDIQTVSDITAALNGKKPMTGDVSYTSDLQVLDRVIALGFDTIRSGDVPVAPKDMMKAIEIKGKLTNNANQGLSLQGLQELRVMVMAKNQAIVQTLMTYVPEDKQAEALNAIEKAQRDAYKNMDVTAQGNEILRALQEGGINL